MSCCGTKITRNSTRIYSILNCSSRREKTLKNSRASIRLLNRKENMSDETIHQGLDGVVVDTTAISKVMPEINSLVYRGYPVQELAEHCSFEEVAWLIWHGELPTAKELSEFMDLGRGLRDLSLELLAA